MKNLKTHLTQSSLGLLALGAIALPGLLQAQPTAHYVAGVEGIKAASLPPPGVYVRDYNVVYYSDTRNDARGHGIDGINPKAVIYANVPRVIWITEQQVLGGFLGLDALIPLQYTDLQLMGKTDHNFGAGDFFVEGTWSKHIQKFDFSLGVGVWAPTGDSSRQPPQVPSTRAGLGYWGEMLTAGATWYVDDGKKLAISALNRYEFNQEKDGTDITPGQAYTVEGGISYTVCPKVDIGAISYYQQKVTTDSGTGASNERDRVAAVGPEISAFCGKLGINTSVRYLYEFMAESRLQGHTIALTLTKRF